MFPLIDGDHPFYQQPPADQALWRYMDFVSLIALLDSRTLFLPSAATLQAADPFEGSVSRMTKVNRKAALDRMAAELMGHVNAAVDDQVKRHMQAFDRTKSHLLKFENKWTYISCWHMNDCESVAMWKLYSTNAHSVAIRTNFERLRSSLHFDPETHVIASTVKYLDYAKEPVPENFSMAPFFHKRKSFEHEKEFRVVAQKLPRVPNDAKGSSYRFDESRVAQPGLPIQADLSQLIQCIYVSPEAPYWVSNLVSRLLDQYTVPCAIRASTIVADVLY